MKTQTTASLAHCSPKETGHRSSPQSSPGKSRPAPLITTPALPLVMAAKKPRNRVAVHALLKKSGPHDDKRRAQKILSRDQVQSGLDEVRRRSPDE